MPVCAPQKLKPKPCSRGIRVCGIDPGTVSAGYGVIEYDGSRLVHIDNGLILSKPTRALSRRLLEIYEGVSRVLAQFSPQAVALEGAFFAKNARSTLALGYGRAVVMLACEQAGVQIYDYQPLAVKKCVTGYSQAEKEQVQKSVKMLLGLPEVAATDAADALAVAICHTFHLQDAALKRPSGRRRTAGRMKA